MQPEYGETLRGGRRLDGVPPPAGVGRLKTQEAWPKERFFRHRGNAEVVRQDLLRERPVASFRRLLTAEARATVRFETPPGRQLQIDFGQLRVPIADERVRVLEMATERDPVAT